MNLSNKRRAISKFGKEVIVVTGGIATGKSFVMEVFKRNGLHIFNSDEFVSSLMKPNGLAYKKVIDLVPECLRDGYIDKRSLSRVAFNNKAILTELEGILYPFLRQYRDEWIQSKKTTSDISIAIEIPLYFEKNVKIKKDVVLSTICTIEIQRTRALARNKMDSKTIDKIIADQVSNEYRQQHADILIYTDLTHEDTVQQVEGLLDIA